MKYKICNICGKEKHIEEFYRNRSKRFKDNWDCRDSYCKSCRGRYTNARRRRKKRKIIAYLGGKCDMCGLTTKHIEVYDIHHNDPSKKDVAIANSNKSFESLKSELDNCSLYCANCHRIVHNLKEFAIVFGAFKE